MTRKTKPSAPIPRKTNRGVTFERNSGTELLLELGFGPENDLDYHSRSISRSKLVNPAILSQKPKNPGSIRNQLINPATIPTANTANTITFSFVVFGFPPRVGKKMRKRPPTPTSGANAA